MEENPKPRGDIFFDALGNYSFPKVASRMEIVRAKGDIFCDALRNFFLLEVDVPPSSLMDSVASPRKKTTKGKGVGARSLARNTSGVEGCVGAPGWD